MASLPPLLNSCSPRPREQASSDYAADLHKALQGEIGNAASAFDFFAGTHATPAMRRGRHRSLRPAEARCRSQPVGHHPIQLHVGRWQNPYPDRPRRRQTPGVGALWIHRRPDAMPSGSTRASPPSPCTGCSCATRPGAGTPRLYSAPTPTGVPTPSSPPTCSTGRWRPRSRRSAPTSASKSSARDRWPQSPAPTPVLPGLSAGSSWSPTACGGSGPFADVLAGVPPCPLDSDPAFFDVPGYPRHPESPPAAARPAPGRSLLLGLTRTRPLTARADFVQSRACGGW